ncbi:related to histone acetyltransferase HPA2 and related acetyltransferases [Saccharomycodes ludwigii]|uniref:Related to histone acetyltransferase HPA2 and related acetyltransferases n=1 Tax=Saccharomycodes ludwigii TaxID=36035 RepID=A0A376B1J7_9ASCO|nr:hypothetical protein SCDLUD_002144 [Saccharomycodes ludwigii]KAH3902324.1 hypothetical protein SCDLUD_002144 [Saccharomycodes ludwigii]SSD58521.1 related to histone acetyltransferase HPA2 and related acetyltransferases [Saccharomycodes ludwigii]
MPEFLRNGPVFPNKELQLDTRLKPIHFKRTVDDESILTAFPIYHPDEIPLELLKFMWKEFNKEIEGGLTYPQFDQLSFKEYKDYWFHSFTCIVLETSETNIKSEKFEQEKNWDRIFCGSFYIKPNYLGHCSHNCNAGFFVPPWRRKQKIAYRMGQIYLKWAPLLGYTYSVFNLVFVSNVGSVKIWDKLEFNRIGYVPNVGKIGGKTENTVKSTDAIIFGKNLTDLNTPSIFADFVEV